METGRVPIITLQIEGMRESLKHSLMLHSRELTEMTNIAIDNAFSTRNIQEQVQREVNKAIDEAIAELSGNYDIKRLIKEIVLNAITDRAIKLSTKETL